MTHPGQVATHPVQDVVWPLSTFTLESGERLAPVRLGAAIHGRVEPLAERTLIVLPGTANDRHSAEGHIGPGLAYDTDQYCVIAVDGLGAGSSSQPADGLGSTFPAYSVRDMMRLTQECLRAHLNLTRVAAVAGASMGAFQALEWAIHAPDTLERAILLVPAASAGPVFRLVTQTALEVLRLDPRWNDGNYREPPIAGLRAAGRLYYPWTVTDDHLRNHPPDVIAREQADTMDRAASWDAWNFIRRYQASVAHDVSVPFGGDMQRALGSVRTPLMVMPSASERLLDPDSAREIAHCAPHATYQEIPSSFGHLAWRANPGSTETDFVTQAVTQFLRTHPHA